MSSLAKALFLCKFLSIQRTTHIDGDVDDELCLMTTAAEKCRYKNGWGSRKYLVIQLITSSIFTRKTQTKGKVVKSQIRVYFGTS